MNYGIIRLLGIFAVFLHADTVSAQGLELNQSLAQSTITKCLVDEKSDGRNGSACINQFTDMCLDKQSNFTTVAMRQCIALEYKVWDQFLNDDYRALMDSLDTEDNKSSLRQAQRNWNKFIASFCPLAYQFKQGTMFLLTGDQCVMEMTARQDIELKKLIGDPL